jgi:predicted secreted protein
MALNGNAVIIYIGANAIGGQTNVTINRNLDVIDKSAKGDNDAIFLPGRRNSTLDLDALFVANDTAMEALQTAVAAGSSVTVKYYQSSVLAASASAYITSMSMNFPDQDNSTIAVSLQIDGAWGGSFV